MVLSGKTSQVRERVLSHLEDGTWKDGDTLPGARDLARDLDISFVKVQHALETLALDGVIEIRPRVGTVVRPGWRERVLRENLSVFNRRGNLPWVSGLQEILARDLPGLRITDAFPRSLLEIKNLLHVQQHHDEYLDLSGVLAEVAPEADALFGEAFAPCRVDGRLYGVPLVTSPRVAFVNPALLQRHGCQLPAAGWTWEQFMDTVRTLVRVMPAELVLDWVPQPFFWLNIVMRAGGRLFDARAADPIAVDHPRTRLGLRLFQELADTLGRPAHDQRRFADAFAAGEAAIAFEPRQFAATLRLKGATAWDTVPMPLVAGGADVTSQAADLACVRASCTDPRLARTFIAAMLSAAVQDHYGRLGYGIPTRKISAFASLDLGDRRDTLLLTEMGKMRGEPMQASADLARLVVSGVDRIVNQRLDIDRATAELAAAARLRLAIEAYQRS